MAFSHHSETSVVKAYPYEMVHNELSELHTGMLFAESVSHCLVNPIHNNRISKSEKIYILDNVRVKVLLFLLSPHERDTVVTISVQC